MKIPIANAKSPTLFIIIALIAALFACIRWNQKFINKYEHKPTPSHPTNICNKLSPVTKIIIKKVNKDKYDIKRFIKGSSPIYSNEYIWTAVEIDKITNKRAILWMKKDNKN